jgi:electron transport complex protein RnfE
MNRRKAELLQNEPERFAHHDRIFLNNPVVMLGMGLAPLVVMATSGRNALMLATAVVLLLTPTRVLGSILLRHVRQLLPRSIAYSLIAAAVYFVAYQILTRLFGTELLTLGIYLPMLCAEPLIVYRAGSRPESLHKALAKGVRVTIGYVLVLLILGCVREAMASGTVFGYALASQGCLPMASMPAGGFILLGVLCAVWRTLARHYKRFLINEAENQIIVSRGDEKGRKRP